MSDWITVPREPTEAMKAAAERVSITATRGATSAFANADEAWAIYSEMIDAAPTRTPPAEPTDATFVIGDRVRKTKGSSWQGVVVGTYSTSLTPEGYAVESEREPGSVQIYPRSALAALGGDRG